MADALKMEGIETVHVFTEDRSGQLESHLSCDVLLSEQLEPNVPTLKYSTKDQLGSVENKQLKFSPEDDLFIHFNSETGLYELNHKNRSEKLKTVALNWLTSSMTGLAQKPKVVFLSRLNIHVLFGTVYKKERYGWSFQVQEHDGVLYLMKVDTKKREIRQANAKQVRLMNKILDTSKDEKEDNEDEQSKKRAKKFPSTQRYRSYSDGLALITTLVDPPQNFLKAKNVKKNESDLSRIPYMFYRLIQMKVGDWTMLMPSTYAHGWDEQAESWVHATICPVLRKADQSGADDKFTGYRTDKLFGCYMRGVTNGVDGLITATRSHGLIKDKSGKKKKNQDTPHVIKRVDRFTMEELRDHLKACKPSFDDLQAGRSFTSQLITFLWNNTPEEGRTYTLTYHGNVLQKLKRTPEAPFSVKIEGVPLHLSATPDETNLLPDWFTS